MSAIALIAAARILGWAMERRPFSLLKAKGWVRPSPGRRE
jgi:hypothetical protein